MNEKNKFLKKVFLIDCNAKDNIDDLFMLKLFSLMEGRDGRAYLNVILADNSGEMEARVWNDAHRIAETLERGQIVRVKGKVNLFQGRKQLVISEIYPFEDLQDLDISMFAKSSVFSPEVMLEKLVSMVNNLDHVYIKELLLSILADESIRKRLKLWPAGKSIHHAYQSGLLEHILSCAELALFLSSHYRANQNYVLAGAILHDLCKIEELSEGPVFDYTDEGKLLGHLVLVLELFDRYANKIENFPQDVKTHLKHILISHHGEFAFGSPKTPMTKEAYLVHLIDLLDSKMGTFEQIFTSDTGSGHWSQFIKHLDRVIYKRTLP